MTLTIYHHPSCSKSRKTLELIRSHSIEPRIVEYLRAVPDEATILRLARLLDKPVAELVRQAEAEKAGGMPSPNDDEAVAAWLARHPEALQRPIVVDENRNAAAIGRPPENVLGLLASRD